MFCRERERLIDLYLAVVSKNAEAAPAIAKLQGESWSQEWWQALQEARERSHETSADLNRHRSKHGC
jgi:hypothetical protein